MTDEATNQPETAVPVPTPVRSSLEYDLLEALSADGDRLYSFVQDQREEILVALLRNPNLDHDHLLVLLKRRNLAGVITALYNYKRLLESYRIKYALVAHPDTPPHIAQALLPALYLFDLLKLCLLPVLPPDIKLAAERKIVQQLPHQPLGNKMTLARRGTAAILDGLLREGTLSVLELCLSNPHLKEGAVNRFLASPQATAEAVSAVARHERWKSRPNIRLAILKNPRTPLIWFSTFSPQLPVGLLRDLLASPRLTAEQKAVLRQRCHS